MTDLLRILIVAFLLLHGLSHVLWFLVAWTPWKLGVVDGPWVLPGEVTMGSWAGRIIGLVAIAVAFLLLVAALALAAGEPWWRGAARYGAFLSILVVLPWWPRIPHRLGLQAVVADIVLLFAVALPFSVELVPPA